MKNSSSLFAWIFREMYFLPNVPSGSKLISEKKTKIINYFLDNKDLSYQYLDKSQYFPLNLK
jgi:hypothetical protein